MTHTTPLKVKKTFASYFISLVSLVTLVFSFFASFALNNISVQANTYPDIPIYTLVNSPLTIGSTEIKAMTPSDLNIETNGVKATYINSPYSFYNGPNRIYITLNNGSNTYPPSSVCIDGSKFNESTSGSGIFVIEPTIAPFSGVHNLYIPDFYGDCTYWSPNQDYTLFNFYPNESLSIAITTTPLTDSDIYFDVTKLPTSSTLKVNGKVLTSSDIGTAAAVFTQQDINDGKVMINTTAANMSVDSFNFTVTDLYYYSDQSYTYSINGPKIIPSGGVTIFPSFPGKANPIPASTTTASNQSANTSGNTQVTAIQIPTTQPNEITKIGAVLGIEDKMTDKYIYGLKATSHSAFKPLSLSNKMRLSKTSGLRNSRFTFTLTNIVKIDPELKDLNCELISFSGNDKVLASGKLDNKGKCVIAWTPGNQTPKGKFSGYIRIVDPKRGHIYTTSRINLNLR